MDTIVIYEQVRNLINKMAESLTEEQLFVIPEGFDNNIAWNLGHIVIVQQALIYRLAGLPTLNSKAQYKQFKPGSSPAEWDTQPDMAEVITMLKQTTPTLRVDYQNGAFQNFQPYTTTTRFVLNSVEEAIAFNNFHEGLHFGAILAIRNFFNN